MFAADKGASHTVPPTRAFVLYEGQAPPPAKLAPPRFLTLPNPANGRARQFCLHNGSLLEVQRVAHDEGSMFVGNTVHSECCLFLTSPFDPLFVLLPLLVSADGSPTPFRELGDVLASEKFRDLQLLHPLLASRATTIAKQHDLGGSDVLLKLDPERALDWLQAKLEVLRGCLLDRQDSVSVASTFLTTHSIEAHADQEMRLRSSTTQALEILSDFVPRVFVSKLCARNTVSEEAVYPERGTKRKAVAAFDDNEPPPPPKAQRTSSGGGRPSAKPAPPPQPPKTSRAHRELEKVNKKGMATLQTLFSRKAKKDNKK